MMRANTIVKNIGDTMEQLTIDITSELKTALEQEAIANGQAVKELVEKIINQALDHGTQSLKKETKPFRSVKGVLKADLSNLEKDLSEIRAEAWKNFPREEPK